MLQSSFQTPLNEVSNVAKEVLGTLRFEDKQRVYKYIQYDTGAGAVAGVAGNFCYYYAPAGDFAAEGYTNSIVTSDLSDSAEVGAGVLQAAMTDGQYGWIQIKGPATLNLALTAGADGDPLTPTGSTDGTLDVTALVTDAICAYAQDISDKTVILDCVF